MSSLPAIDELRLSGVLPSPKGVALAVMELCQDETATLDDVARVVMTDPALSGKLIRHANAASMGGRPVVSVGEAVRQIRAGFGTGEAGTATPLAYVFYGHPDLQLSRPQPDPGGGP